MSSTESLRKYTSITLLLVFCSAAQVVAQAAPEGTSNRELFLKLYAGQQRVVALITIDSAVVDTAYSDSTVCGEWHWAAESSGGPGGTGCEYDVLSENELHSIKFEVDTDGTLPMSADYTRTYYYFQCESGYDPDDDGFYCPNGSSGVYNKNDLMIYFNEDWGSEPFKVIPDGSAAYTPINWAISSNWLIPHNLDVVKGSDDLDVSFFFSPQSGPAFNLAPYDLHVHSSRTWTLKNVHLSFGSGKGFNLDGKLKTIGATLIGPNGTGSGSGSITRLDDVAVTIGSTGQYLVSGSSGSFASGWAMKVDAGATASIGDAILSLPSDVVISSSGAMTVGPSSTLKLGGGVEIVAEGPVDFGGTQAHPISVEQLEANDAWGSLELWADGNELEWVVFDGADDGVKVLSEDNVLSHVTVRNGGAGIVALYGDVDLSYCTIEDNTEKGLWVTSGDASVQYTTIAGNGDAGALVTYGSLYPFRYNTVEGNAVSTDTGGIVVQYGGDIDADDGSYNVIHNNTYDEVVVANGGQANMGYYGGGQSGGYNDIFDDAGGIYVSEGTAYTVYAENNCWGGTPKSFNFEGTPDYLPYLVAGNCILGGQEESALTTDSGLYEAIREAQKRLLAGGDFHAQDVASLYSLQRVDREDELGERSSTMDLISAVASGALLSAAEPEGTRERAVLTLILDAVKCVEYATANSLLKEYDEHVRSSTGRMELDLARIGVRLGERDPEGALSLVYALQNGAPQGSDVEATLTMLAELITDVLGDRHPSMRLVSHEIAPLGDDLKVSGTQHLSTDLAAAQAYPNPFNPVTVVTFELAVATAVLVSVYDLTGREVEQLTNGRLDAGRHHVAWDASQRASGTYFVVLRTDTSVRTIPVTLLR